MTTGTRLTFTTNGPAHEDKRLTFESTHVQADTAGRLSITTGQGTPLQHIDLTRAAATDLVTALQASLALCSTP